MNETEPAQAKPGLDFEQIRKLLPHRFPLFLLDRVSYLEPGRSIVALKNVTGNELHFLGHFPGLAVLPGSVIIESAAQALGLLCAADTPDPQPDSARYYLSRANISFHIPVTPGDQMVLEATILRRQDNFIIGKVNILVGGKVAARGELTLSSQQVS